MIQTLAECMSDLAKAGKMMADDIARLWTCLGCLTLLVLPWLAGITAYLIWGPK